MKLFYCIIISLFVTNYATAQTYGCTDPLAVNYNSTATQNDGSCRYDISAVSPVISRDLPATLRETSGLIFWNDKLWTHNDNSDINIYAIDTSNISNIQSYSLAETINTDWEEISQDSQFIYIGDFGNNSNGNRTDLKILRIEKKSLLVNNPLIDTIFFRYSLQTDFTPAGSGNSNFDCESLIVSSDSIYLFTKEWISNKTSLYSLPKIPGIHIAHFRDIYDVKGLITGATYFESKRLIVLCGYSSLLQPFLLLLYDFKGDIFFKGNKRKVSVNASFHQTEGIASENGLLYYLSNEKYVQSLLTINQGLQILDLTNYLKSYLSSSFRKDLTYIKKIELFPNPASKTLTVKLPDDFIKKQYSIKDMMGRNLLNGQLKSNNETINLDCLKDGIYLFCVKSYSHYLIIQH